MVRKKEIAKCRQWSRSIRDDRNIIINIFFKITIVDIKKTAISFDKMHTATNAQSIDAGTSRIVDDRRKSLIDDR